MLSGYTVPITGFHQIYEELISKKGVDPFFIKCDFLTSIYTILVALSANKNEKLKFPPKSGKKWAIKMSLFPKGTRSISVYFQKGVDPTYENKENSNKINNKSYIFCKGGITFALSGSLFGLVGFTRKPCNAD